MGYSPESSSKLKRTGEKIREAATQQWDNEVKAYWKLPFYIKKKSDYRNEVKPKRVFTFPY